MAMLYIHTHTKEDTNERRLVHADMSCQSVHVESVIECYTYQINRVDWIMAKKTSPSIGSTVCAFV